MLTERGTAIARADFEEANFVEKNIDAYVKSDEGRFSLERPTMAFVTFEFHEAYHALINLKKHKDDYNPR